MIIHNPEITGSLSFPRTDGTKVIIQLSSEGGLETVIADATGSVTGTPQSNFSGSFTGSFVGDGSQITGVAAASLNIDLFTAGTIVGDDQILFSDTDESGTEKRGAFKGGLDSVGVISGSSQVSFTTISDKPTLVSGSGQIVLESADKTGFTGASSITTLGTVTGGSVTAILPSGTVSGSSQVDLGSVSNNTTTNVSEGTNLYYTDTRVKDKLNTETVISGSSQVSLSTTDVSEGTNLYYTDTRVKDKLNAETVISGSSQVSLSTTDVSEGTNLYYTDTRVKDKLNTETVVSGSGQIVLESADKTGFTGASSITTLGTVTAGSVTAILPSGTVSGSSQVSLSTTDVSEGTNLYYTDARVKTKLNTETVVSGSGQILTLVSIDEDNMASNSDTKLPTQQSVKSYVDGEITALISGSPATLDTLNELAAALGDDPNFATTVSTAIGGKVSQSLEIISGNGLTGGGNLTTNRTLAVGGTTNRISVSATAVDIASTYVGQSSITTLGTITTGNVTAILPAGTVSGSAQINVASTTGDIALGTRTSGNYVATMTAGTGITVGTATGEGSTPVITNTGVTSNVAGTGITVSGATGAVTITNSSPNATHTGDVTGATALTIANNVVTNAKAADMAVSTIKGRATTGTGDPEDLSASQVRTILNVANGAQVNVATNLGITAGSTAGPIVTSSTGTNATLPSASGTASGVVVTGNQTFAGIKTFSNSTASTSKTTGAVIVTGGVGISGALNVGGDVVAFASSDRRLKDNIVNIEDPIQKVQKLNGVTWDWNSNADELQQSLPNVGVIAQEVEEVFPQLVHDRDNGYKGVDYAKLTGLLIEAVKEQQKQIDELKSRLQ